MLTSPLVSVYVCGHISGLFIRQGGSDWVKTPAGLMYFECPYIPTTDVANKESRRSRGEKKFITID